MRMLLTADWQAEWANLDLCQQAANEVYHLIGRHQLDWVWVLGDLKRHYNPVDMRVVKFWQDTIEHWRAQCKVGIILGNHDREGQTDDKQNWLPVLYRAGAHVYQSPVEITGPNGVIFVLPWSTDIDRLKKKLKQWRTLARKNDVLLFHQDVRDARYNLHESNHRSEGKLSVGDFYSTRYLGCFGGHVHLHQNVGRKVWYVGSPFATDWGEANQRKGYVLVDTSRATQDRGVVRAGVRFIESKIPRWFDETWGAFRADEVTSGSRLRIHVPCEASSNYVRAVEQARADALRKYPGATVYVVPEFNTDTEVGSSRIRTSDPDAVKIKAFVRHTVPDILQPDAERVTAYLVKRLEQVVGRSLRTQEYVQFIRAKARNFLSFKEVQCDFTRKGITVIQGRNNDWAGRSNGAGKTSYLQLIPVGLFGRTFKGQTYDRWARRKSTKAAKVECELRDAKGRVLLVQRQRRPTKLRLSINNVDNSSGLRGDMRNATQGLIEQASGYTWQTLANSIYIDQSIARAFLSGTRKERSDVISKFQNLERFDEALKIVKRDLHNNDAECEATKTATAVVEAAQGEAKSNHDSVSRAIQRHKRVVRSEVLDKQRDFEKLQLAYDKHRRARATERLIVQRRLRRVEHATERAHKAYYRTSSRLKLLLEEIESLTRLVKTETCPTCLQKTPAAKLKKLLRERTKEYRVLLKVNKQREHALKKLRERQYAHAVQCDASEQQDQAEYARVIKARDIARYAEQQAESNKRLESLSATADKLLAKIRKYDDRLQRLKQALVAQEEMKVFYEYAAEAFTRDGIPQFLSQQLVPVLNKHADYYADLFCDKIVQVIFEADQGEFEVKTINATGGETTDDQSDGERALAGLITSFALREIAPRSNVLILDEPGAGLDPGNARQFAQALKTISKRAGTVFVTSHNAAILGELGNERTVTVSKTNGASKV